MRVTLIKRILKSGLAFFRRNTVGVTATIVVMSLSLSLINGAFFIKGMSDFFVEKIKNRVDISVYFDLNTNEEKVQELKKELAELPGVKEVRYVSPEETLREFKERHKDDEFLMESLEEIGTNPFSASLNIRAYNPSDYKAIADFIEKSKYKEYIEKVDYQENREIINNLFRITKNINRLVTFLVVLTGLLAVLVAFNTLRLIIYNTREEITIMRLVGASNWFIRAPFLVQGIIIGIVSGILTFAIFGIVILFIDEKATIVLGGFSLLEFLKANWIFLIGLNLFVGVLLGTISTLIVIGKYLKR